MITRKIFLYLLLSFITYFSKAQNHGIQGNIKDKHSGKPIVNAYVFLENTSMGTSTNPKGFYKLGDVPIGSYTVVVTASGYLTYKDSISIVSSKDIDIELSENLRSLPELVVESQTLSLGRMGISEIPGSVSYISPEELSRYRYTNVNDILKMVPGVNIQEEDGFGLRPNIGLRGSGLERSSRVAIMEDGILAAPAPYSSPSAYYFPTAGRMNGVEVLKGASQIKFGPFTTGGAINFLSTPIPTSFSSKLQIRGGSYGFRDIHAYVGQSYEQLGFLVETFQYSADGFKELSNGGDTGFDKKDYQLKFRLNTKPDRNVYQSLSFTLGRTNELANETYLGLTRADFDSNPYQRYAASQIDNMDAEQSRLSAQHYIEIPGWFNVVTTVYRNNFKRNWYKLQSVKNGRASLFGILSSPEQYDWEYQLLTGQLDTDTASLITRANNRDYYAQGIQTVVDIEFETGAFSHDIHLGGRIHEDQEDRFQWEDGYAIENGVMRLIDQGAAGSQANRIETANAMATYILYKLDIGRLSLTPGLRYENVNIAREDFGKNDVTRTGADLTKRANQIDEWIPGIGINYALDEGTNLFGGVHKGFAPPGSAENTQPEKSINYELGIRKLRGAVQGSAVMFLNDYSNLLGRDAAASGGIGTGEVFNAGEAITRGLELSLATDLLRKNEGELSLPLSFSYTLTDAFFTKGFESDFDEWGTIDEDDQLPYIARNQVSASIGVQHQRFAFHLNSRYQGQIRTIPGQGDEIPQNEKVDGFFTVDLGTQAFLHKNISLNLSVVNLLNNQYAVATRPAGYRPGMPRAFNFGINVSL